MDIEFCYRSLCKLGDTVLDVGAHVGQTAGILSNIIGPEGMIYSFEPHPEHFLTLCRNIQSYGMTNTVAVQRVISRTNGFATLFSSQNPSADQSSTIISDLATESRFGEQIIRWRIETESLDNFCRRHDLHPTLIKIDVEGAEGDVLAGATATLESERPNIYFECGYDGQDYEHIDELRKAGFLIFCADIIYFSGKWFSMSNLSPYEKMTTIASTAFFKQIVSAGGALTNLIAVPSERSDPFISSCDVVPGADFLQIAATLARQADL